MTTYAPNAFQSGAATAGALRSYAPNPFAGSNPSRVTSMAPHLSVAAADRPLASDVALLQSGGYGGSLPDLDTMWRQSPQTYQTQVAEMLRQPAAAGALTQLKTPPPNPDYVYDDDGRLQYRYDEDGNVLGPRMRPTGGD